MATTKDRLHRLVDELAESELHAAERFLEFVREKGDPLLRALANAPIDDEPETHEEAQAVKEALEDVKAGRVVSHEEARRQLLDR